ncbi:DDE-type integrase/transposase/recombinase [Sanguibacter sp. HDW7]|uniref:DDE-type integrase/transposase/recombinase n=1 Tax=Sanguibacter sp. HDW7 TaxID=2714931 RepID=UPI00197E80AC|nr:DDE-type integrase/transposase/recombinase [Sanguibacter sp. HDW7]
MADRTAELIASANDCWSSFGKKHAKNCRRPGPPVHDELCVQIDEKGRTRHVLAASGPNELWLTDQTEHKTTEGKHYICAIKDAFCGKIVEYAIDSRPKSRLVVRAIVNAVAMRGDVAG